MPKEPPALTLPPGRPLQHIRGAGPTQQQATAPHLLQQQHQPNYSSRNPPQPASFQHLQPYHHLSRPSSYQYYAAPFPVGQNDQPAPPSSGAQTTSSPQSALRDAAAAYERALKLSTTKYERNSPFVAYKMALQPYDHPPAPVEGAQSSQSLTSNAHYDLTTSNALSTTTTTSNPSNRSQPAPKIRASQHATSAPYDCFSKKKLAVQVPEAPSGFTPYTSQKALTNYGHSASYERTTPKTTAPSDAELDTKLLVFRHKLRFKYDSLKSTNNRRPTNESSAEPHTMLYDHQRVYDAQTSSNYDRIGPPSSSTSTTPCYERSVTTHIPSTSYERLPTSSAYERRAAFDRAYEQAAYERRSSAFQQQFPLTATTRQQPQLQQQYYQTAYSRLIGQNEDFDSKDLPTSAASANMFYPIKPRLSLLTSPEYLCSLSTRAQHQLQQQKEDESHGRGSRGNQPSVIVPPSRSPSDSHQSKPKLREGSKLLPPETLPPLHIDISVSASPEPKPESSKPSIYMPTVEPISPTSPSDTTGDDGTDGGSGSITSSKSSAKDNLLLDIARVDREINKIEHLMFNLKRKEVELEQKAKKTTETTVSEETTDTAPLPQHFSYSHKIYSENRRKAKEAHSALNHLGPEIDLPLYNQPSDSEVYRENKLRHLNFKTRLISHLKMRRRERCIRELRMTEEYAKRTDVWNREVERMENSPERKRRDTENRELFEKIFPKIRKEREDRERFLRVGSRIKSDADLEEIMDNLHEQDLEVKKIRAAVPPLLLTAECRRCVFVNNNGFIEDFASEYKDRQLVNVWSDAEKEIFREKYLLYPKNFGVIASFLEKKSVNDCVQYYYLSKKTENYRRLLRKYKKTQRTRTRNKNKPAPAIDPPPLPVLPLTSIPARFQRDYKPEGGLVNRLSTLPPISTEAALPPVQQQSPMENPSVEPEPPPLPLPPPPVVEEQSVEDAPPATPVSVQESPPCVKIPLSASTSFHRLDVPIVIIDDSDDSNSGSHFSSPYLLK